MEDQLFVLPQATRAPLLEATQSAHFSIYLWVYRFIDLTLAHAFVSARARGVEIIIIIDHEQYLLEPSAAALQLLKAHDVQIIPSSKGFASSTANTMIIDKQSAYIMSCDFSPGIGCYNRDYIHQSINPVIINDLCNLFGIDLANAKNNGKATPAIQSPQLFVSPTNASTMLSQLVTGCEGSLIASTQIADPYLIPHFTNLINKNIPVRLILPNDVNGNSSQTYTLLKMIRMGVQIGILPTNYNTATLLSPYGHGNALSSDGSSSYIGSQTFTTAALTESRAIGIGFQTSKQNATLLQQLEEDWRNTVDPAKLGFTISKQ